eukprot:TRINITY_DN71483_c0_g1_i1.p1 TRINITY_DN71483_c0_g1~~TRINITY_DN71483_c0_g1_i1.p1  ORF type:complete len:138 (+),score=20.98 TRINITY_DN71483_c0_g1_i1:26-439(+)
MGNTPCCLQDDGSGEAIVSLDPNGDQVISSLQSAPAEVAASAKAKVMPRRLATDPNNASHPATRSDLDPNNLSADLNDLDDLTKGPDPDVEAYDSLDPTDLSGILPSDLSTTSESGSLRLGRDAHSRKPNPRIIQNS